MQHPFAIKPIPGWEGLYSVTEDGRVWSHERQVRAPNGRVRLKPGLWLKQVGHQGYLMVGLHRDGKQSKEFVHRLVGLAFLPAATPEQTHTNHKDSNRRNNHYTNLEWCTHGENIAHAWKAGAMKVTPAMAESFKRVQAGRRVFTEAQAAEIRSRVAAGESQASIAREKQASRAIINLIVKNRRYLQTTGATNAL